jgi:hypothetical protein
MEQEAASTSEMCEELTSELKLHHFDDDNSMMQCIAVTIDQISYQ